MTYRVRDWAQLYENNRTRELKRLDWAPIPNRMDGDDYTELVDHQDGASHLGAWLALRLIASRCDPRGTLVREGGRPHDFHSLSRISRIPASIFETVIPRLLEIGCLEIIPSPSATLQDGAEIPQAGAEISQEPDASRAREEGNGREGNGREHTSGAVVARPPDLFDEFIGVFLAAGKLLNDRDLEKACRRWQDFEPAEHAVILAHVKQCVSDGTWSDARHTPIPRNYLDTEAWTRRGPGRILPDAPRSRAEHGQALAEQMFLERHGGQQ